MSGVAWMMSLVVVLAVCIHTEDYCVSVLSFSFD